MRDSLDCIAALEPSVGAFAALRDAGDVEREAALAVGPLAGIAVAVKDIFDTRDLPTRYGSPLYAGPARCDAAIVGALRRAGAVIVGKTTTTEFAYLQPTSTRNPAAAGRTPGGSSAGSAAAVAAGMVPFAVGSQTAGSTIRPASYCGVVGFKPTFGLLPTAGLKCFSWSLDTVGLFAASVAGVARFAGALTGHEWPEAAAPSKHWTFAVPRLYPWPPSSDAVAEAMGRALDLLRSGGATVVKVDLPPCVANAFEAHADVQGFEAARSLAWEFDHHADRLSPGLREYLAQAREVPAARYRSAQQQAAQARTAFVEWSAPYDALLMPSAADEAPPMAMKSTGASTFNRAITLLGAPSASVPGMAAPSGAPVGVQVVTGAGRDAGCLQAAAFVERALRASPGRQALA